LIDSVVVDASPLIILAKSSLADIIPSLFNRVSIADAVWDEIMTGPDGDPARTLLPGLNWLERKTVPQIEPRLSNLGKGEAESLTIALKTSQTAVLTDDYAARRWADALGVPYLGTGRLLAEAQRRGLISSLEDALNSVRANGLWISDNVIGLLIDNAGN
jgi:predicted nucleic acid-binding protein